jgi:hypothetical protein
VERQSNTVIETARDLFMRKSLNPWGDRDNWGAYGESDDEMVTEAETENEAMDAHRKQMEARKRRR